MSVPLVEHSGLYSLSTIFNLEFLFAVSAMGLYGMLHPFMNFGSHYKKKHWFHLIIMASLCFIYSDYQILSTPGFH